MAVEVSVIIPAFNCEKTIPATIHSILTQKTKKSFELIVVDDASTDNTALIVQRFEKARFFQQEKLGPAHARNLGAKKADGKLLLFIDADCIANQKWLNEMITPFRNRNVSGVQGAYKTAQREWIARFTQIEIEDRYDLMKASRNEIDWIGSYSAGYRKEDFFEAGGFDESFPIASGEDPALSFKISASGKKIIFNQEAIVYHKHPASFFKYFKTKFFRAFYRIMLYEKFPKKAVKDSYTPQILKIRIILIWLLLVFLALFQTTKIEIIEFISILLIMLLLLSTAPFSIKAVKKDLTVGTISPAILIARDFIFLLGLIAGTINSLVRRR
ncbi:MAG: glycosyltransferase [Candidatus Diapherotrites archaeon]